MRRLIPLAVALALALGAASIGTADALPRVSGRTDLAAYRGLGTWVDVRLRPRVSAGGRKPAVTTRSFDDMADLGVKTVYLQAAEDDDRSPGDTIDPKLLGRMLRAAHAAKLRVVAWYLPHFTDVNADFRRVRALLEFQGQTGSSSTGSPSTSKCNKGVPDATDAQHGARRLLQARPQAGRRPPRRRHRARAAVPGRRQPRLLARSSRGVSCSRCTTSGCPRCTGRTAAPTRGTGTGSSTPTRTSANCAANSVTRTHPCTRSAASPTPRCSRTTPDSCGRRRRTHAIGWSIYDYNTTVSSGVAAARGKG